MLPAFKLSSGFFRSQKGAVSVVEAALVYPVVIISCIALIYAGIFMYESAVLESRAASVAVLTAKNISFSGLEKLADDGYSDSMKFENDISGGKVRRAYRDNAPYRYLVASEISSETEKKAIRYAADTILPAYAEKCKIEVVPHLLSREVSVKISRRVVLPHLFHIIGIDESRKVGASSRAIVSDPAEFLRNTDIAFDTAGYISERFGLDKKKDLLMEKIKSALERFGVKKK